LPAHHHHRRPRVALHVDVQQYGIRSSVPGPPLAGQRPAKKWSGRRGPYRQASPPTTSKPLRHRPGAPPARRGRCPSLCRADHQRGAPMSLREVEAPRASAVAGATPPESNGAPPTREIRHEYARALPPLLSHLGVSLLVSTYQAGKVVAVGVAEGELTLSYHNFERVMGLAVKPDGIAVAARAQVWFLQAAPPPRRPRRARRPPPSPLPGPILPLPRRDP